MTVEERRACVAALPSAVPFELHPPEGDRHSKAEAEELVQRLERAVNEVTERAQHEAERAQHEAERANDLEQKLAAALAEIEKLRSR
ncbi:MAG TPA: hypothetical protein VM925_36130 [Labilithrix sp.]|nr:hypothetical protein [Labilithrix sp.]